MSRDNRASNIIVPNTTLTLAKKSYSYRAAEQWNSIPFNIMKIKKIKKIGQFKFHLKKWIHENIAKFDDT